MFNITSGMIDSHFHALETMEKGLDIEHILSDLYNRGLDLLLDAGVNLDHFPKRLQFKTYHPGIYLAAGIHPNTRKSDWPDSYFEKLKDQSSHNDVKALGETGLDFYREYTLPKDQFELLEIHYEISHQVKKPLIFHCRSAEKELNDWIAIRDFPYGAILHCFTGDEELGKTAIKKGFMISYAGNVTFKNAEIIRESLKWIPLDRLLIETDSPYLSPHPLRGKINHPGHIGHTYESISKILEIPLEDLVQRINRNFRYFLQLNRE